MLMGLRAKFFAGMFGIVALLGVAMIVAVNITVRNKLIATLQQRGISSAQNIAANSVEPVLTEQFFQMELMFHELKSLEEDILYIFVLDPAGRVLAHTFADGFPTELKVANPIPDQPGASVRQLVTDKGEIIDIAVPLLGGELGGVRLGLSEAGVQKDVDAIIRLIVWLIVAVLLVGGVGVAIFDLIITKPILTLAAVAQAAGRGDMEQRADLRAGDEIGLLGRSLDRMLEKRRQVEKEKEELIAQLQQALEEIKTLKGILPICASCKKIRDDNGCWTQMESFIRERADVDFTHGICPDCARKIYPEFVSRSDEDEVA